MSSFYSIDKYSDILFSYFSKVVPMGNHEQNIKFRNKVALNAPELHGIFKRLAALLVSDINYEALSQEKATIFKESLPQILAKSKWKFKQYEIFYNLFMYDYVVTLVYPFTSYKTSCQVCGKEVVINESFGGTFKLHREKEGVEVILSTHCKNCNRETKHDMIEVLHTNNFKKYPMNILLFNPFDVSISEGYGGSQKVYFSPTDYRKRSSYNNIKENTPLGAEEIINVPYKIISSILYNKPLKFNNNLVQVFRHPEILGLQRGLSPLMLSLSTVLHTSILRKGREADALLKVDPHYIVSPVGGANSPVTSLTDGRSTTDFIMKGIKQIKENDSNGLIYSPNPVQATPIFAQGTRWITSNEILAEEANLINSTGFDMSVLQGGAGIQNDPYLLHTLEETVGFYVTQSEDLLNKLVSQLSVYQPKFDLDERIELLDVSQSEGTQLDNLSIQLVESGQLPKSVLYRKYGYNSIKDVLAQVKEEQLMIREHEINLGMAMSKLENAKAPVVQATGNVDPGVMKQMEGRVEEEASMLAQQLYQMDEGTKRSELDKIQKSSYILWATTVSKLKDINQQMTQQAKSALKEQGGM